MARRRDSVLGQVLRIYLNHLLGSTLAAQDRLRTATEDDCSLALQYAALLEKHIRCAIDSQEAFLCSTSGIIALLAIDRAEDALRFIMESTRSWSITQTASLRTAAWICRRSSLSMVNMLAAEVNSNVELARLWETAGSLFGGILRNRHCIEIRGPSWWTSRSETTFPSKPATLRYLDQKVNVSTDHVAGKLYKQAAVAERNCWACKEISSIISTFSGHLSLTIEQAREEYQRAATRYKEVSLRSQCAARFADRAADCADERAAAVFLAACKHMQSMETVGDASVYFPTTLLSASSEMEIAINRCDTTHWYALALGAVGCELQQRVEAVRAMEKLASTATAGSTAQRVAASAREWLETVAREVQASVLFTGPSGDQMDEFRRLTACIQLVSPTLTQEWTHRQYCVERLAAAEIHRGLSAAHDLLTDCWSGAVSAMDHALLRNPLQDLDTVTATSAATERKGWVDASHRYVRLAEGVASEAVRLAVAATNSRRAGRAEAAQAWSDAAGGLLRIGQDRLTFIKAALPSTVPQQPSLTQIDQQQLQQLVRKHTELAQLLDKLPADRLNDAESQSTCQANWRSHLSLLRLSAAHGKAYASSQQGLSRAQEDPCDACHRDLEKLADVMLAAGARDSSRYPVTLNLAGTPGAPHAAAANELEGQDGAAAAQALVVCHSPLLDWLPDRLQECSALLFDLSKRADMGVSQRAKVLKHMNRFVKEVSSHQESSLSPVLAEDVVRRAALASVRAGRLVLDGQHEVAALFAAAAKEYSAAVTVLRQQRRRCKRMDVHLIVADRIFAAAVAQLGPSPEYDTSDSDYADAGLVRHFRKDVDRLVGAAVSRAELAPLRAEAAAMADAKLGSALRTLYDKCSRLYKHCIHIQHESMEFQLVPRSLGSQGGSKYKQHFQGLLSKYMTLKHCACRYSSAAQALRDPLAPAGQALATERAADYQLRSLPDKGRTKWMRAAEVSRWYKNVVVALRTGLSEEVREAWQRAADKGAEVYEAEMTRGGSSNNSGSNSQQEASWEAAGHVAYCLADLASAITKGETETAEHYRAVLEQLLTVEQCVLCGSDEATSPELASRLIVLADAARDRIRELKEAFQARNAEAQGGGKQSVEMGGLDMTGMTAGDEEDDEVSASSVAVQTGNGREVATDDPPWDTSVIEVDDI